MRRAMIPGHFDADLWEGDDEGTVTMDSSDDLRGTRTMSPKQQEYARKVIDELLAEARFGVHQETGAITLARHWMELDRRENGGK